MTSKPTKMKTAKTKVVKAFIYLWPEDKGDFKKGKIVFERVSKMTSEPLGLTEIPCTISFITPKKTK